MWFADRLGFDSMLSAGSHHGVPIPWLDDAFSGLVLVAKTWKGLYGISWQVTAGQVARHCLLLVRGWVSVLPAAPGVRCLTMAHLLRDGSQGAVHNVDPDAVYVSLLALRVVSGVRLHVGGVLHGECVRNDGKCCTRELFHQFCVEFVDSEGKFHSLASPIPSHFREVLETLLPCDARSAEAVQVCLRGVMPM